MGKMSNSRCKIPSSKRKTPQPVSVVIEAQSSPAPMDQETFVQEVETLLSILPIAGCSSSTDDHPAFIQLDTVDYEYCNPSDLLPLEDIQLSSPENDDPELIDHKFEIAKNKVIGNHKPPNHTIPIEFLMPNPIKRQPRKSSKAPTVKDRLWAKLTGKKNRMAPLKRNALEEHRFNLNVSSAKNIMAERAVRLHELAMRKKSTCNGETLCSNSSVEKKLDNEIVVSLLHLR